jgi:hypothetical protein
MVEVTDGKRTIRVPEGTAQAMLSEDWLKAEGWTIVKPVGTAPQEVIQFQQAKLKEIQGDVIKADNVKPDVPGVGKSETDLSLLSIRKLEEILDTLTSDQLLKLKDDARKTARLLAEKKLKEHAG